jgi:hypothetical protein
MDETSTLDDFTDFVKNEKRIIDELGLNEDTNKAPKKSTISNLLNYSKSLSIRKSEIIEEYKLLLN